MESEDESQKPIIIEGEALDRYFDLHDALKEFSSLFSYEEPNDRAIVVVGGAFLDLLLLHILLEFFPDDDKETKNLFDSNSILGTYSAKYKMAYSLGLINKTCKDDLRIIGKIRNKFAHELRASFADERIESWCLSLKWHEESFLKKPPNNATTRDIFQVGAHSLISYLNGIVSIARGKKRKIDK